MRYVVAGQPIPGYEVAYQGDQTGVLVLRDPNAPPRAYFVGEVETLPNEEAVWARVHEPTFDPGRTALVEQGVEAMTTPIDSTSVPSVEITRFTPDEIVYSVETDAPRLLVASEVYYPAGWKAFVDGAETPILRVDHLLRGIQVPAGAREVTMRFEPAVFQTSFAISAASSAIVYLAILILLGLAWRRRESDEILVVDATGFADE